MTGSVNRTYKETIQHYQNLRNIAHEFTEDEFKKYSVSLREIEYRDVVEADRWSSQWSNPEKTPTWNWERMYYDYTSNSGVKRFDVSLSRNGILSAICYGVPTKGKLILKLHAISRKPDNNPLQGKVLTIILFAADAYARLLGCEELWICNPMNENLVDLYKKSGYEENKNRLGITTHLSVRLNYE